MLVEVQTGYRDTQYRHCLGVIRVLFTCKHMNIEIIWFILMKNWTFFFLFSVSLYR